MDKTSQLGNFVFFVYKNISCHLIDWISHKSKRSFRSVIESEVVAFADALDMSHTLKFSLEKMHEKRLH